MPYLTYQFPHYSTPAKIDNVDQYVLIPAPVSGSWEIEFITKQSNYTDGQLRGVYYHGADKIFASDPSFIERPFTGFSEGICLYDESPPSFYINGGGEKQWIYVSGSREAASYPEEPANRNSDLVPGYLVCSHNTYDRDGLSIPSYISRTTYDYYGKAITNTSITEILNLRVSGFKLSPPNPQYPPNTDGRRYCTLKAYLGSEEKFSQTFYFNRCPVVNLFEDTEPVQECPPSTCKVDCHTHYCCYNSQGISVFNYMK